MYQISLHNYFYMEINPGLFFKKVDSFPKRKFFKLMSYTFYMIINDYDFKYFSMHKSVIREFLKISKSI